MVPKQTIQIQEDHEERTLWTWGRPSSPPTAVLLLSLLPVGHQHGCQSRTSAFWGIYEQFWTLVPRTPAGLHAKDSDDVTDKSTQHVWDKSWIYGRETGAVSDTDIISSLSHSGGRNGVRHVVCRSSVDVYTKGAPIVTSFGQFQFPVSWPANYWFYPILISF